jgi:hypothetical protein
MRKLLLSLGALLTSSAAAIPPVPPPPPPAPPPRLVVVIGVDQLAADLWDEYRPHFRGGFARLAGGVVFRNGYQSHAATETCPGHSTILTGARPARNGVVANSWVDQSIARTNKTVYCAEDVAITPAPGAGSYTVSPVHLKVRTLGEILKARSPQSLSVAVAGKDRSAVMLGGRVVDQRWYWDGKTFSTDLAAAAVPRTLPLANAAVARMIAAPQPPLEPPPVCAAKAKDYAIPGGQPVGGGRLDRAAGDISAFRVSPALDASVLAIGAGLVQELGLGRDSAPDVLALGLAATDYVGHRYGSGGQEMCLQLMALDRELASFFDQLDRSGIDYAVAMTADHGVLDIPERLRDRGIAAAARVDRALSAEAVGAAAGRKLGLTGDLLIGGFGGDVHIHRSVSAANRPRLLAEAAELYRAHPQVEAVFTKTDLTVLPMPSGAPDRWTLQQRVRASFDARRSGDLLVVLKAFVQPIPDGSGGYLATHGSPWDYDRRVPIAFWRRGMAAAAPQQAAETVDIMPTLAAMLGLALNPASIDGKCLAGISGVACTSR